MPGRHAGAVTSGTRPGQGLPRPLATLLRDVPAESGVPTVARITGITNRADEVEPGFLFVAIRGTRADGNAFLAEAVARGAAAVCVDHDPGFEPGVPVVRVRDARRALARLAAAWHGEPAARLSLIGITGTVGKTSTLSIIEAILLASGRSVGSIGSLGFRIQGESIEETAHTTPDPLVLHRQLARAADAGCEVAAVEITSHALVQARADGLRFDLGVFTNLVPLEHSEYHRSFRAYAEAKRRFLDHLGDCAPLIYSADDRVVRRLVHHPGVEPIGCGTARRAVVRIEPEAITLRGTRLTLNFRRPLPILGGGEVAPFRLPLELRLLGRSNLANAALAAAAALCLGADPDRLPEVLPAVPTPDRRMQVIHDGRFTVLDDTVGHPDSLSALFEVVRKLAPARVHIAYAVRGRRGPRINRQSAQALAVWCAKVPLAALIVTRAIEAVDELNRVEDREYRAFLDPLRQAAPPVRERDRLEDAVHAALRGAEDGDLVLLLGAQGMDGGQDIARSWLRREAGGT